MIGNGGRLPRLIPEGAAREFAFTGRNFLADEGERLGLINRVFASHEALTATVRELAQSIAAQREKRAPRFAD